MNTLFKKLKISRTVNMGPNVAGYGIVFGIYGLACLARLRDVSVWDGVGWNLAIMVLSTSVFFVVRKAYLAHFISTELLTALKDALKPDATDNEPEQDHGKQI